MHIAEDIFDGAATYVNSFKGVTHNYQRSNFLNMWFTFAFANPTEKKLLLQGLEERFGITEIFELSNLRYYKLNVFFDMEGK